MVVQGTERCDGILNWVLKRGEGKWQKIGEWAKRNLNYIMNQKSVVKSALSMRCPSFYCFQETSEALRPLAECSWLLLYLSASNRFPFLVCNLCHAGHAFLAIKWTKMHSDSSVFYPQFQVFLCFFLPKLITQSSMTFYSFTNAGETRFAGLYVIQWRRINCSVYVAQNEIKVWK